MTTPRTVRPVFATEDFRLIRRAIAEFVRANNDDPETAKFVSLHHRLGRLG